MLLVTIGWWRICIRSDGRREGGRDDSSSYFFPPLGSRKEEEGSCLARAETNICGRERGLEERGRKPPFCVSFFAQQQLLAASILSHSFPSWRRPILLFKVGPPSPSPLAETFSPPSSRGSIVKSILFKLNNCCSPSHRSYGMVGVFPRIYGGRRG